MLRDSLHSFCIDRSRFVKQMKKGPFLLATDGSNNKGPVKVNPLLVRLFGNSLGYMNVQQPDICCLKIN